MKAPTIALVALVTLVVLGCALYSDVVITPLQLLPTQVYRGSNLGEMLDKGDFLRALAAGNRLDFDKASAKELAILGEAELAMGRLSQARVHLRRALDLRPPHTLGSSIAWNLSQLEYLANQHAASLEWAREAEQRGMTIRQWHLDYLESLSSTLVYQVSGPRSVRIPMKCYRPVIPRVESTVNGIPASAVIDTGATLSIVSASLAGRARVLSLGDFRGTFYGLAGEPIPVRFALIDALQLGDMKIVNVPVAIMDDDQMKFAVTGHPPFQMDFLMGTNLLKEMRIELDYSSERVRFTHLSPVDRHPSDYQNLFFLGFRPFVHAAIDRRGWYLFVLDTGSEITFLNESELTVTSVRFKPRIHGATLQGLGGAKKRGSSAEDVLIGVDKWAGQFRTLPLYSTEQSKALGILGENFLRNFRVTIDFGTMRVELVKEHGPFSRRVPIPQPGRTPDPGTSQASASTPGSRPEASAGSLRAVSLPTSR